MFVKTSIAFMICLLGSSLICAQENEFGVHRETVQKIIATELEEGQAFEMLESLLDAAPKRLSGSPGAAAAVEWARQTMTELGLENVRLEPCMVPRWTRGIESLNVLAPEQGRELKLPITALGGSVGTPKGGIIAELIEVQSLAELRARADEAKGKLVLFNRPMDRTMLQTFQAYGGAVRQRSSGAIEAAKAGALGAIVRSMTTRIDDFPHTGGMRYADGVKKVPAAAVSTRGAEQLAALIRAGEAPRVHLRLGCRWHEDVPSANVVGELVGREKPDEIVLVGGHLDAWDIGTGAHDDGAGCSQSLEALRLLKSLDLRPRRTLRVVLFANEENGLRGGRAYAEAHKDELDKHVMALESDRGGFTPRGFTTNAAKDGLALLREAAALLDDAGCGRVYPGGGGADISPMGPAGVPLVGFLPDSHRYFDVHHSANDVIENVNERELELGAGLHCGAALVDRRARGGNAAQQGAAIGPYRRKGLADWLNPGRGRSSKGSGFRGCAREPIAPLRLRSLRG